MAGLQIPVETKPAQKNLNDLTKGFKRVGTASVKSGSQVKGFRGVISKAMAPVKNLISGFGGLKLAIVGLLGATAIGGLAKSFLNASKTSEGFNVRLKVLLGSAEAGQEVFKRMSKFAGEVPFQFEEIMESSTSLAGVLQGGVDEISEWMPLISDLAAATGLSVQDTTGQIIRMYSAGAASADMFRERGVLAMLGFQAGVSVSAEETRKRLMEAFKDPQSQFAGAAEELSKTWSGMMSMMSDKWFAFRNMVMDAGVFEFAKAILSTIVEGTEELRQSGDMQRWAENTAQAVIKAFGVIIKSVGFMIDAFKGLKVIWLGLKGTWFVFSGAVLKGVAMINDALSKMVNTFASSVKSLGAIVQKAGSVFGVEAVEAVGEQLQRVEELSDAYSVAATEIDKIAESQWDQVDAIDAQLDGIAAQGSAYKKAGEFLDEITAKMEKAKATRRDIMLGGVGLVPEKAKKVQVSKEDLKTRGQFDKAFDEATLSEFQLESQQLDELMIKYQEAGVEKARLDEWYAIKREEILGAESERSIAQFEEEIAAMEAGYSDLEKTIIDLGATIDNNFADGLTNAFIEFGTGAKSAKKAFSDFATSFGIDIARMIIKQTILNALQSASGPYGAAAGIGLQVADSAFRADGGSVFKGRDYIVGEERPERFVSDSGDSQIVGRHGPESFSPKRKGRIEPDAGGGQPVQVTIANITDPNMLNEWAASQQGQEAIMNVISNNPERMQVR